MSQGRRAKHYFILIAISMTWATSVFTAPRAVGATTGGVEDGVRIDLPANGRLRIENRRGGVSVEVWNEKYVAITAATSDVRSAAAPVRIERTDGQLAVSVAALDAGASAPAVEITLNLFIPAHAQVIIVTDGGEVRLRGLPRSVSAQTAAGDIRVEVQEPVDADVTAQSRRGTVAVMRDPEMPAQPAHSDGGEVQMRLGAGGKVIRLRSESGRITLSATTVAREGAAPDRRPPSLGLPAGEKTGAAGTPAPAASSERAQEVDEDEVVRVDTKLVTLNVSVVDRGSGRGLTGLAQGDFKVYEDGAEQTLAHFESSAAPFDLFLLIDLSGSTREVVKLIQAAALRFVAAARPQDRIAIITFAGTPVIVSPLTTDRRALRSRINLIDQPQGSTKLYDALGFAMDQFTRDASGQRRRAIVLMSDGLDSSLPNVSGDGSVLSYQSLRGLVQELDGVLYALWLNTEYEALSPDDVQPETVDLAHDRMRDLAEAGGGTFYEVERLSDLAGAYERVAADLGTVYSLSYRPTNIARDGGWRAIRINLPRHPQAAARGKRGYYAH